MSEMIAATASAGAVADELTTLIDWTLIDGFSGLIIIVENAGGGSADDISDVQIDTSDDGGIADINLDQHAGVPAVPIAAGNAPSATFTETAKFVRVRALCAEGEDTTAKAYLLGTSTVGKVCLLADIKDRLGITSTEYDLVINRIITGLLTLFESTCKRPLIVPAAAVTEYYTGRGPYLRLRYFPKVSISSIKIAYDYDFDSATALTENTDYRLANDGLHGILFRPYADWPNLEDSIQAIYRGGYCAVGVSPAEGEYAWPADLREAGIEQGSFIFKRRDDIGLSGVSFDGGSFSKNESIKLLPMVRDILMNYTLPPTI